MGIFLKARNRLLRVANWGANQLASEVFAIFGSDEPITIDSPVTFEGDVTFGRPAIDLGDFGITTTIPAFSTPPADGLPGTRGPAGNALPGTPGLSFTFNGPVFSNGPTTITGPAFIPGDFTFNPSTTFVTNERGEKAPLDDFLKEQTPQASGVFFGEVREDGTPGDLTYKVRLEGMSSADYVDVRLFRLHPDDYLRTGDPLTVYQTAGGEYRANPPVWLS